MKRSTPLSPVIQEAEALMTRFESDPAHVLHVRHLSVLLWKDSRPLHALGPETLVLLETAALLHDTGWSRSPGGQRHHKHSADIIREHPWKSLRPGDVELAAQTARYHRKTPPHPRHKAFNRLDGKQRDIVSCLGAILRLADALDRSHTQSIHQAALASNKSGWVLKIAGTGPLTVEKYGFAKKKGWFEEYFQTKITLDCLRADFSEKLNKTP